MAPCGYSPHDVLLVLMVYYADCSRSCPLLKGSRLSCLSKNEFCTQESQLPRDSIIIIAPSWKYRIIGWVLSPSSIVASVLLTWYEEYICIILLQKQLLCVTGADRPPPGEVIADSITYQYLSFTMNILSGMLKRREFVASLCIYIVILKPALGALGACRSHPVLLGKLSWGGW